MNYCFKAWIEIAMSRDFTKHCFKPWFWNSDYSPLKDIDLLSQYGFKCTKTDITIYYMTYRLLIFNGIWWFPDCWKDILEYVYTLVCKSLYILSEILLLHTVLTSRCQQHVMFPSHFVKQVLQIKGFQKICSSNRYNIS